MVQVSLLSLEIRNNSFLQMTVRNSTQDGELAMQAGGPSLTAPEPRGGSADLKPMALWRTRRWRYSPGRQREPVANGVEGKR